MAAIKYTDTFKRKASLPGYMFKGFYYQFSTDGIYALEGDAVSQLQSGGSTLYTAMTAPVQDGYCLTVDMPAKETARRDYRSVRIWCLDLMLPDVGMKEANYQLVGAMEFHYDADDVNNNTFQVGVNNMVFIKMEPNCSITLANNEHISHIIGSDMDKDKYARASDKGTFLEMPCAKRLLMDDRFSRFRKKDVFQIATSGLITI